MLWVIDLSLILFNSSWEIFLKDEAELKFWLIYPLPALLISLPLIPFTSEEIASWTHKVAKDADKAGRNLLSCSLISCVTVPVILSIDTF